MPLRICAVDFNNRQLFRQRYAGEIIGSQIFLEHTMEKPNFFWRPSYKKADHVFANLHNFSTVSKRFSLLKAKTVIRIFKIGFYNIYCFIVLNNSLTIMLLYVISKV